MWGQWSLISQAPYMWTRFGHLEGTGMAEFLYQVPPALREIHCGPPAGDRI